MATRHCEEELAVCISKEQLESLPIEEWVEPDKALNGLMSDVKDLQVYE
jgi:hypothetical protein